jgi:hypothetical protein
MNKRSQILIIDVEMPTCLTVRIGSRCPLKRHTNPYRASQAAILALLLYRSSYPLAAKCRTEQTATKTTTLGGLFYFPLPGKFPQICP